jgi:hypothetical protein
MALQTAILVAFTQIIPEHQIQMFGVVKVRVKVCKTKGSEEGISSEVELVIASAHGIRYFVDNTRFAWLSVALDQHSMGLDSFLVVLTLLQAQPK